jgi:hypothetical protein
MGNALNLSGGRAEWESMAAPVQTVTEDVDAGRTEVGFGPPAHLSPQDLVELLRGTRRRNASSSGSGGERTTGTPGKSANVMGPTAHPSGKDTTPPSPAAETYDLEIVDASSLGSGGTGTGPTPGQIRVRAGSLGGVWPTSMTPGDPSGSEFYLTLTSNGTNPIYVLGKVAVADDGTFGAATVYQATSTFTPDDSFVYLVIGTAVFDGTTLSDINNDAKGSQFCIPSWSPDGTIVSGNFGSMGA